MRLTPKFRSAVMLLIFLMRGLLYGQDAVTVQDYYAKQIADLKAEFKTQMDQMRDSYEARIATLENNVQQIHAINDKQEAAIAIAAQSTSGPTNTEAVLMQAQEIREGVSRPWKTFDWPSKGFEFHGYLRSSFGLNGNGAPQVPFGAPQVMYQFDSYYRLGNEPSNYGELNFLNNFLDSGMVADGQLFKVEITVAFTEGYFPVHLGYSEVPNPLIGTLETWQYDRDDRFSVLQVYAEGAGVLKSCPEAAFWVGQRSYLNPEIHMNRLALVDMSGYGCGVKGIPVLGDTANLSLAWIGGTLADLTPDGNIPPPGRRNIPKNNFILSLENWQLLGGSCTAWATFAVNKGGNLFFQDTNDPAAVLTHFPSTTGCALGLLHTKTDLFGGFNQACIQWGYGAASNFYTTVTFPGRQGDHSWTFRVSDYAVFQPVKEFSIGLVALWQESKTQGTKHFRMRWISAGIRPVYHFDRNWSIALEAALDHTQANKNILGGSGTVYKFTVAPQLTPDWDFAVSPVLRLYVTYANWTKGFKSYVGGNTYRNNTNGMIFGAQVEAFW